MSQQIENISLLVKDYEEAILFYTQKLGFDLLEDITLDANKRWVLVGPKNTTGTAILLAKAVNKEQAQCIGNQAGGRVFLFLHTTDFWQDYRKMLDKGIVFLEEPRTEAYGTVVVFQDLYGNKWDLLERKQN